MPLDRHKTVRQALQYVDRHPEWPDENLIARIDMPIWELVARNLFDKANHPDITKRGSLAEATRAQKIILNRLSGTRRMGTNPAVRKQNQITLTDLTIPSLELPQETDDGS
jgi:hypothetical protein